MLIQCIESTLKLEIVENKRKRVENYSGGQLWKDYLFFCTGQNSSVVRICGTLKGILY